MAAGLSPTPASDAFCCGLVLLELATGQLPWVWAPVVGEGPQRSPESLAQVARAGGQVFYDMVVLRTVCVGLHLTDSLRTEGYSSSYLKLLRNAVAWDYEDRLSVTAMLRLAETYAEFYGVDRVYSDG
ncbi:hypothetical protein NESM_000932000 [Novymonas esmeraldas]|uniref:Protein kinase domain-containing protein n=1 Tax=Novymonas esmeraldas TaxID=1808958 RepID=A0AAW0F2W5_9TRYP